MLNIVGLVAVIVFYLLILIVGIWASRKSKSTESNADSEDVMLAGRNIGVLIGIFTMTATWVGGGYINGTAEIVARPGFGLIWCQAPFCYAISLVLGGLFFAKKMRLQGYVTMLDPFQKKYGDRMGGLLFIPALLGDIFWSAAVLSALGASLSVIIGLDNTTSVIVSACISVLYTLFGGLYSVAYTDVVQMTCMFVGLWLSVPFAMMNSAVKPITETSHEWIGNLDPSYGGVYLDCAMVLAFGGLPWQAYFQRVLSSKSALRAQILSYVAAFGCIVMATPPLLIGAVAYSTDWNATGWDGEIPLKDEHYKLVLPMVLQYLCPQAVSFIGLGGVSAAVMSSADSCFLSASAMFSRNVYKNVFRQKASERELIWVMRVGVLVTGAFATALGITITTIYGLWFACSDLVFVILFPQLVSVIYLEGSNTYGALAGYIVGLFVRISGGEPLIHLRPFIEYPWYIEETNEQLFPIRLLASTLNFVAIITVSYTLKYLFEKGILPKNYDVFRCIVNIPEEKLAQNGLKEREMTVLNSKGSVTKEEADPCLPDDASPDFQAPDSSPSNGVVKLEQKM